MIIDATNLIAGRIATIAVNATKKGEDVQIVNCEKAVITGDRRDILAKYHSRRRKGSTFKGPFIPTKPKAFMKRTIRGMIPYKKQKGKLLLKKIRCFQGMPENLAKAKHEIIKEADVSKTKSLRYISIGEICQRLKEKGE